MDHRHEAPGENGDPVPRDLPDQQAGDGEDPWEVADTRYEKPSTDDEPEAVPDTDEAGTGRQGATRSDTVHPEHPGAEESTG